MELSEFLIIDFDVEAGEQVLEDDCLDDATLEVVDLFQCFDDLCLLSVEVVCDETWGDAFLIRGCGDDRLTVKGVPNRLCLARDRSHGRLVRHN